MSLKPCGISLVLVRNNASKAYDQNIFQPETTLELVSRIKRLTPETKPLWGKMNAGQMLAHLCVMYEMVYDSNHKRCNAVMRFLISLVAKETVIGTQFCV